MGRHSAKEDGYDVNPHYTARGIVAMTDIVMAEVVTEGEAVYGDVVEAELVDEGVVIDPATYEAIAAMRAVHRLRDNGGIGGRLQANSLAEMAEVTNRVMGFTEAIGPAATGRLFS
jgi:hypothetical protein